MIEGVKHIIFDLGGVIINIDYAATITAFKQLGVADFEAQFSQAVQSNFFERFEKGLETEDAFFEYIRSLTQLPLSDAVITDAWNAMLLDIPLRRLQILQQLELHYNTFLFSNTNSIHEAAFNKQLKSLCGMSNFAPFFNKVYLSHHLGMRKPDTAAFQYILDAHQLHAADTLFIDDSIQHVEAASSLGMHTIHLKPGMCIEHDIFRQKNQ